MNEQTCPECRGLGILWSPLLQEQDRCWKCNGEGTIAGPLPQIFGAPSGVPEGEKLTREELNYESKRID